MWCLSNTINPLCLLTLILHKCCSPRSVSDDTNYSLHIHELLDIYVCYMSSQFIYIDVCYMSSQFQDQSIYPALNKTNCHFVLHTCITEYTWKRLHFIKFVYPHHHHHPLLQLLLAPPSWPWGPVVSAWSVSESACHQWSSQTPLQTLEPETPITTATVNNGAFKLHHVVSSSDSETQPTGH